MVITRRGTALSLPPPKWERVLYKQQKPPFSDNHTDERQFLDQLRTNVNVVRYTFLDAVKGGAIVMSQMDLIVVYLVTFEFVQLNQWGSAALLYVNFAVCAFCLGLLLLIDASFGYDKFWCRDNLCTLATVFSFGYAFTPVIRTLTTSISTDSIWAISILLFLSSLVVHDYGMENAPIAAPHLSVNLCLAASMFLISRVQSDPMAFLLLGLSLLFFCFWPHLRNALFNQSPNAIFLLFPPLAICSIWLLIQLDALILAIAQFSLHVFIVGFCPWLLVRMQQLKSTIHGPWDEATLTESIHQHNT